MALRKFAANIATLTAARMLQTVSSFLAIPILARLLGPSEFGLVAIASTFVLFTMAISDAGLGQTLVRVPAKDRAVWSSAFWLITAIGLGLSLLLAACAWPTAWLMNEPRLLPILLALAPLPLIEACAAVATAELLQREQFRHLAFAELLGSVGGTVAAIGLAFAGAGVWALVAQQLVYWAINAAIILGSTKFWPDFTLRPSVLGQHLAFGRDTAMLNVVGFFQRQMDPLVIGRFLNAASVGVYAMAGRVALLPMSFLSMPLRNALFTRMVMIRDDKKATRDLFLVAAWMIAALVFPGFAIGAAAADAYFHVFLSEKWLPAAPVFMLITPALMFQTVMIVCGAMLLAVGATGRRLRLNVEFTIAWLIVLPIAAIYGDIQTVAAAYTLTYVVVSIRTYPMYLEPIGCTTLDMFKTLAAPISVAIAGAAAYTALRLAWPMDPVFEVLMSLAVMGAAYAALAVIEWKNVAPRAGVMRSVLAQRGIHQDDAPA